MHLYRTLHSSRFTHTVLICLPRGLFRVLMSKTAGLSRGSALRTCVDAGDPVENAISTTSREPTELVFLDITPRTKKRKVILDCGQKTADDVFMRLRGRRHQVA